MPVPGDASLQIGLFQSDLIGTDIDLLERGRHEVRTEIDKHEKAGWQQPARRLRAKPLRDAARESLGREKAGKGEVWLSSQNRNYHNRMGEGSLAWLASAGFRAEVVWARRDLAVIVART